MGSRRGKGLVIPIAVGAAVLLGGVLLIFTLTSKEPAKALNDAAWDAVKEAGAPIEAYEAALIRAEQACELAPDRPGFLNTLGVAQLRVGRFADALATLERADELNRAREDLPHNRAYDLIPLAMAHLGLGNEELARRTLEEARPLVRDEVHFEMRADLEAFLREADSSADGPSSNTEGGNAPGRERE